MKNSSLPFSRKLLLAALLAAAACVAFVSPWGVLAVLALALVALFWPASTSASDLPKIDALLQQVGLDPASAEVVLSIRAEFADYDSARGGFPVSIFTPTSRLAMRTAGSLPRTVFSI